MHSLLQAQCDGSVAAEHTTFVLFPHDALELHGTPRVGAERTVARHILKNTILITILILQF